MLFNFFVIDKGLYGSYSLEDATCDLYGDKDFRCLNVIHPVHPLSIDPFHNVVSGLYDISLSIIYGKNNSISDVLSLTFCSDDDVVAFINSWGVVFD